MRLLQARQISALGTERGENRVGRGRASASIVPVEIGREGILAGNGGVKTQQAKIFPDASQRIADGLGSSGGPGRRIEQLWPIGGGPEVVGVGQHPGLHRAGLVGSDDIGSGIWAPGRRTDNVARQIAQASLRVRHVRVVGHVPALPKSLIVPEEEGLVLLQRTSQLSSELIALERSLGGLEEVPRVQSAVAQILEDSSMQLVRP